MKRNIVSLLLALVALLTASGAMAQTLNSSYFMQGTYLRTDMNPALTPERAYVVIPALSGVSAELNTNFFSVDNFFYKKDGQVVSALHSSVSSEEFLGRLPKYEKASMGVNVALFGAGFYKHDMFWNFGANVRVQGDMALSKDIFTALKTLGNGKYNLSESALGVNAYTEFYVGTTYQILDWLKAGARLKILMGIANVSADFDQISANVQPDQVAANVNGTVYLNAPVVSLGKLRPGDLFNLDMIGTGGFAMGSGGMAIDLGAEMEFLDKTLRVSAAVTDLGFIRWSRKTAAVADLNTQFHFNGINFSTGEADYGLDSKMVVSEAATRGYTTMLNCTLNVGAEYNILDDRIGFGLLSHTEFGQTKPYTELTLSANFRPLNWLSATLSHTFLSGTKIGVFGFALNVHCTGFNFYLGTDYIDTRYVKYKSISVPRATTSLNAYFGIGFNI